MKGKGEMMRIVGNKVLILFSDIASRCSAIRLHLKILASPLPDAYTVSTLLPKIAAIAITRLAITRSKVQEMGEDEANARVENWNASTNCSTTAST